jgi:hypothetical protein
MKKCLNCSTEMTRVRSFGKDEKLFAERIVCCRCGNTERIPVPVEPEESN